MSTVTEVTSVTVDISSPRHFVRGRIQRFLLIQLKPKHHRLDVLTTHVTVCIVMLN